MQIFASVKSKATRFGPNRPAAEMEGNGEFDFWIILRIFGDILEDFWRSFEEFWRIGEIGEFCEETSENLFVVRRLRNYEN